MNANAVAGNYLNLQTMRRQLAVSSRTPGIRRLIRPGDEAYAYQLNAGLWEVTNQIQFRGETISPVVVRLLSMSWPIEPSYGVYIFNNAATPTVLDVTRWIEAEGSDAFWTVGDWSPPSYGGANRTNPAIEERLSSVGGTYTPTLTGITLGTGGTVTGSYRVTNGWCNGFVVVQLGTSGVAVGTGPTVSIPITADVTNLIIGSTYLRDATASPFTSASLLLTATTIEPRIIAAGGGLQQITATTPFTWTVNDSLHVAFSYPVD